MLQPVRMIKKSLLVQMTRPSGPVPAHYASAAAAAAAAANKRPRMDGEPRPPFLHGPAPMLAPAYGSGSQASAFIGCSHAMRP